MLLYTGLRRTIAAGVANIFRTANINLSNLYYSAIPATGDLTPNFTRATEKRIPDHEGVLRTCIAGELGFPGARRVRNLLTGTEAFNTTAWSKSNAAMTADQAVAPNGATTADLFTAAANAQQTVWFAAGISGVYSTVYSAYVKAGTATWLNFTLWDGAGALTGGIQVWFNLTTGAVGNSIVGAGFSLTGTSSTSMGDGWYRISIAGTATGGAFYPAFRITDSNGVNATTATLNKTFYIWGAQLEDITGRADQTTPSEYVSVGVEAAPAYHGSMVDGVRCFPYDLDGTPLTTMTTPLIELAATNLCLQSQTFDNASWTPNVTTVSSNAAVAPNGTTTADLVYPNSTGVNRHIFQTGLTTTAATWTFSFYAKYAGAGGWAYALDLTGSAAAAYFDIQNGVVGTVAGGHSARIEALEDDWYRCSLVTTTAPAGAANVYIGNADANGATTITANGTNGIYLWGAQLELGTAATTYIPTTTVAATRNADQLYYTGALIGNIKTLAAIDFKREVGVSVSGYVCTLSDNTTNELAASYLNTATQHRFNGFDGGVHQWETTSSNAYTSGQLSSIAWSMATNDVKFSKDGVAQTQDTGATMPTVTRLEYGMLAGAEQLNGYPGIPYGWTSAKSQSELNAITQS